MVKKRTALTDRDISALGVFDGDNANPNQLSPSNTQKKLFYKYYLQEPSPRQIRWEEKNAAPAIKKLYPGD